MKIVLDTNVFMSAVFFGGIPGKILGAWKTGRVRLVISPAILDEYRRVLAELELRFDVGDGGRILDTLAVHAEVVPDTVLPANVCTDPDDDKFLACALVGKASIICSGDKALLKTSGYEGIVVLSPGVFYREHLQH